MGKRLAAPECPDAWPVNDPMFVEPAAARRLLYAKRYGAGPVYCPACRNPKVYDLAEGRHRCARCHHTFATFTGTRLGRSRLPLTTWLLLVRSFVSGLTARQEARAVAASFPTALRVFTIVQQAIAAGATATPAGRAPFIPRAALVRADAGSAVQAGGGATPVFAVRERDGYTAVAPLLGASPGWLLQQPVRKVRRGGLVYTDAYFDCDTLAFYGYPSSGPAVRGGRGLSRGSVHVDRTPGLWDLVKTRLLKHHRVSTEKFPLYLYETAFRYNHRHDDLFDLLLEILLRDAD